MPLSEACYLASTDSIYGVMENYIFKFDATTGRKSASAKVCAPCYGPMRILAGSGVIYVASKNDFSINQDTPNPPTTVTNRQIWNVDPSTLAVTNYFQLDDQIQALYSVFPPSIPSDYFATGETCMAISGSYLYFMFLSGAGQTFGRVNLSNPLDNWLSDALGVTQDGCSAQILDILGDDWYSPFSGSDEIVRYKLTYPFGANPWSYQEDWATTPDYPTAVQYVPSVSAIYAVAGNDVLHRCATPGGAITTHSLAGVYSGVQPFRLRLSPVDGKLYIPCQKEDVVIIWNPATDSGTYQDGFNSPIDVVFTGSKKWAVQTATFGLREIV